MSFYDFYFDKKWRDVYRFGALKIGSHQSLIVGKEEGWPFHMLASNSSGVRFVALLKAHFSEYGVYVVPRYLLLSRRSSISCLWSGSKLGIRHLMKWPENLYCTRSRIRQLMTIVCQHSRVCEVYVSNRHLFQCLIGQLYHLKICSFHKSKRKTIRSIPQWSAT